MKNVKFKFIKTRTGCQYKRILLLQRKPKLGRSKPSTGPHAAGCGLDIAGLFSKPPENWYKALAKIWASLFQT